MCFSMLVNTSKVYFCKSRQKIIKTIVQMYFEVKLNLTLSEINIVKV